MSPVFLLYRKLLVFIIGLKCQSILALGSITNRRRRSMVKVNGELLDLAGKTISEYLTTTEYDPKRIAVERNGEIVFKSQYDDVVLQDEDSIEVVSFVGGG